MGEMRNAYKILIAKPTESKALKRPIHGWMDRRNAKMGFALIGLMM
jgi:hypothetical protein